MPASAILPEIGASTCAFGNHKCTPYNGLLTMKANVKAITMAPLIKPAPDQNEKYAGKHSSNNNNGKDLRAVYRRRYPPAPNFSG